MKLCLHVYQLPFSSEKAGNKAVTEAWQEKRGIWGQSRKCKRIDKEKSLNKKHEKHYQSWWIMQLCSQLAKVRIILVPMSFVRLFALWMNIVKTCNILVRFSKFQFLKLISTTTVFFAIVIDCWPDMPYPLLGNLADIHYLKDQSLPYWMQDVCTVYLVA